MNIESLKKLTLLYVEDNSLIRKEYLKTFEILFKNTYESSNFEDTITLYEKFSPDLLIVDIQLETKNDGFDIVKKIREKDLNTPIVFLSGYSEVSYILKAINNNVNGYIIKPLNLPKLIKVLKEAIIPCLKLNIIEISNKISYDFNTFELLNKKEIVSLGKKENILLQLFLKNLNKTLTKEEIEYQVWDNTLVSDSAIKNLIRVLRKKIGKNRIINTSGMGWRLIID